MFSIGDTFISKHYKITEKEILEFAHQFDPELVNDVLKVIKELANEGMTMVIVTHAMRFAKEVSNKVVFIHDGEIGEEGSPEELFDHPKTDELRRFLNVINEN